MTTASAPPPLGDTDGTSGQGGYLTRSEERLRVDTNRVVAGHARLEKFTVTETQTLTVEVTHEEVRLVQTAAGAGDHRSAVGAADGDRWMVLSREEVVVSKRVVPVERVRVEVYPVVEQREVTESVRKEQIDTDQIDPAHIDRTHNDPASFDPAPGLRSAEDDHRAAL